MQHPLLSVFVHYSPIFPRSSRLAIALIAAISGLFFSAFFYAFRNGSPNPTSKQAGGRGALPATPHCAHTAPSYIDRSFLLRR